MIDKSSPTKLKARVVKRVREKPILRVNQDELRQNLVKVKSSSESLEDEIKIIIGKINELKASNKIMNEVHPTKIMKIF